MTNASGPNPPDDDRTEVLDAPGSEPEGQPATRNGLGVGALVVGIVAAVLALPAFAWQWAWIAGVVLAAIGLVLGIVGLTKADRSKGVATAGTVVSGAALVLAIIVGVLYGTGALGTGGTQPTASPTPSASPSASPTETPTSTPTQTPTPTVQEWADQTWGTFAKVDASGTGDDVVAIPDGITGGIVTATFDGDDAPFTLTLLDASNQASGDPLVETTDDYDGTTAWGVADASSARSVQVTATGSWTISIQQMSAASELPNAANGEDDAVYLYGGGAATLAATHTGDDAEDPFVVAQQSQQAFGGAALIDVTGAYDGSVPLAAGPSVVTVIATEDWTLSVG
ncbi:DUF4190 domain-containing protein [Agromyces bracchium]|uniref:DUF4190 domain-containing protein n=1 Tax=Agromyces bracchium TaxID=88376 RepID=A0A6I3M6W8_9MICO|nr:DUF4190 domain-containing protein [Agromyces bracchium]MTH67912.1 hypothetical protein [Agromyces bracchium]